MFFILFYFLIIFPYLYLCIFSYVCIPYNCTVHGADLTYISLLVIFCIIVHVTNKTLESNSCKSENTLKILFVCKEKELRFYSTIFSLSSQSLPHVQESTTMHACDAADARSSVLT